MWIGALIIFWNVASAAPQELPKQYITDEILSEEFSERTSRAPFRTSTPSPLSLTSPYFETLFLPFSSVQIRSQGSPGTSIRGSSQAARILFVLDNIPLNFLDGFGGSSLFVPNEILDRIHVFEGPTSATYGANALGGAVHFTSRKPERPYLRLGISDTDASAVEPRQGTLSIANGAGVVPLVHTERDHIQLSTYLEKDRGDFRFDDDQGRRLTRTENQQQLQRYTLLGRHRRERWTISHLWMAVDLKKTTPGSLAFPLKTEQDTQGAVAAVSTQYRISESALWTSRLSAARLHSNYRDPLPSRSDSDKLWLSQIAAWEIYPGILSQTVLDVATNYYRATFANDQKFDRTEPELAQSFVIPLGSSLWIEPTLRYLQRYQRSLSQIHIPWDIGSNRLWFLYSEGFRPPSLVDLHANTNYYVGDPSLRPEQSRQSEVGYQWKNQNLDTKISLFHVDYTDLLQSYVKQAGQSSRQNIGRARSYGATVQASFRGGTWNVTGNYTFLRAREEPSGLPLRLSPEQQAFFAANYRWSRWQATLQQSLWSPLEDLDFLSGQRVRLAEWHSTDALLQFQWDAKRAIHFGIYNLFDARRELTFAYPEPQRRWALAVEWNF